MIACQSKADHPRTGNSATHLSQIANLSIHRHAFCVPVTLTLTR